MAENALQPRFVEWLKRKSRGVEVRYLRWLEDPDGNSSGLDYCDQCAELQRFVERHNCTGLTRVSGWNDCYEADSHPFCDRCGVLLHHALTLYGVEEEIRWLSTAQSFSPVDAWCWWSMLTGMGDYRASEHWPLIEPHADRLLDGVEHDGFPEPHDLEA